MGLNVPPEGPGGVHTGSLNPGTGGVRDTYQPNLGSLASQAEYTAELEREAAEGKKGPITRLLRAVRRLFWGE
jgi:hypothetical protein